MKNIGLGILLCMTACAVDVDSATKEVDQEVRSCDSRCDGWSDPNQANTYCMFACILNNQQGGRCFYPNPNDAFHGYCVDGLTP